MQHLRPAGCRVLPGGACLGHLSLGVRQDRAPGKEATATLVWTDLVLLPLPLGTGLLLTLH